MNNKIMISYAHLDYEQYVKPIEEAFKKAQIDFWIDKSDIESGADWDRRINRGINQCSVFLVVVTPNYRKSQYCFYEAQCATRLIQNDPDNRDLIAIYVGERKNEKLDDYFKWDQSHFFEINNLDKSLIELLNEPVVKKCSLFVNLIKVDEKEYEYVGELLGQTYHSDNLHFKIMTFYESLMTWYQRLYENQYSKINSCDSFVLYKHKLKPNEFKIVLSSNVEESTTPLNEETVILNTKKLLEEMFYHNLNEPYLSVQPILEKNYSFYYDLLNDYRKLYNLSLFIQNDHNYIVNDKIIKYALDKFLIREKIDLSQNYNQLLTNITANNQTYINYPTLSLIEDQSIKDLFLYGETGCGKTISMIDLVNQIKNKFPVLYLPLAFLSKPDSTIQKNIIENNTEGYNISFEKLTDYAKSEKVYLIIDGANEAHEYVKGNLVNEIDSFSSDFSIIITSRTQDIVLNKSLLQDKEFPRFTYGKYHLLSDNQVIKHLSENNIEFDYERNKLLFDMLKNNLRLKMFTELRKDEENNSLDLSTPGELLYAYFFDSSANSIASKLKQDHYRNLGREAHSSDKIIDSLFEEVSEYAINNKDLTNILKDENQIKLLSSLGIFEKNEEKLDFTHSEYRHFFEAMFLKKIFDEIFDVNNHQKILSISKLSKYLLAPHISYETLFLTANLTKIHLDCKYLFENLFKMIKESHLKENRRLINRIYVLVALGLNNEHDLFDTHGLIDEIPSFMFDGCNLLHAIRIPNGVKVISRSAFFRCENLTNIILPDSLNIIRSWAFIRCSNIRSINITSKVHTLGTPLFVGCEKLKYINVDSKNKNYYHSSDEHVLLTKKKHEVIYVANGAEEIEIPSNATSIEMWAFKDAKLLKEVNIPSKVTHISSDAFDNCYGLLNINVDPNNKVFESLSGLLVRKNKGQYSLVRVPSGRSGVLEIPSQINKIEHDSISTSIYLEEIVVPNTVTSIGDYAYADCVNLIKITYKNLSNVTINGKYIFLNCTPNLVIYDERSNKYYSILEFEKHYMIHSEKPQKVYQGEFRLNWQKIFNKKNIFEVVEKHEKGLIKAISIQRGNKGVSNVSSNDVFKILVFGLTEYENLASLSSIKRKEKIRDWINNDNVVAILITRDLPIYDDLRLLANEYQCDLLSFSNASTTKVATELDNYFRR